MMSSMSGMWDFKHCLCEKCVFNKFNVKDMCPLNHEVVGFLVF